MALWSVSNLESKGGGGGGWGEEENWPLAEDVMKLEPIVKFSNLISDSNTTVHCERVRNLSYNKNNYVS